MSNDACTWQPPKLSPEEALASQLRDIDNDIDRTESNKAWAKQKLITEYENRVRKSKIEALVRPVNEKKGFFWDGKPDEQRADDLKPRPLVIETEMPELDTTLLPAELMGVVDEVHEITQAPPELIVVSLLPTVAACGQHIADVQRDAHLVGPLSLFGMGLAESGERKTTIDRLLNRAIREWQEEELQLKKDARKECEQRLQVWSAKKQAITTQLKSAVRANKKTEEIEQRLLELEGSKPRPVMERRLLRVDDTMEALNADLELYPFAFIQSSEAGSVVGGYGMGDDSLVRYLALFNQGWDGFNIPQRRKTVTSVEARQVRMSASLQLQPSVMAKFQQRSGGMARGIGTFARTLMTAVQSTMGDREYRVPRDSTPHLDKFAMRCKTLLDMPANVGPGGVIANHRIRPDAAAHKAWVDYYNAIEDELKAGREYADLKDSASKSAENAARIAASWHLFLNGAQPGALNEYSYDLQRRANGVARYFLDSTLYAFNVMTTPQGMLDAREAEEWIVGRCKALRVDHIAVRDFTLNGPWRLRRASAHKDVLSFLDSQNRIYTLTHGPKGGETLHPHPAVMLEYLR